MPDWLMQAIAVAAWVALILEAIRNLRNASAHDEKASQTKGPCAMDEAFDAVVRERARMDRAMRVNGVCLWCRCGPDKHHFSWCGFGQAVRGETKK